MGLRIEYFSDGTKQLTYIRKEDLRKESSSQPKGEEMVRRFTSGRSSKSQSAGIRLLEDALVAFQRVHHLTPKQIAIAFTNFFAHGDPFLRYVYMMKEPNFKENPVSDVLSDASKSNSSLSNLEYIHSILDELKSEIGSTQEKINRKLDE